ADRAHAVVGAHLDAGRPAVLDGDLGDRRCGADLEVRQAVLVQVADRGAVPQPVARALLEDARALLRLAVVVVVLLHAGRLGERLDERLRGGGEVLLPGDLDRTAGSAQVARAVLPVLQPLEAGQHVVERPPRTAVGGPVVVVLRVAADEQQAVDRAGAAEHPAARLRDLAVQRMLLRNGVIAPVQALLQLRDVVADRDHAGLAHQHRAVRAAGLEQDHARTRLGQALGQHAAGAARSGDYVVGSGIHFGPRNGEVVRLAWTLRSHRPQNKNVFSFWAAIRAGGKRGAGGPLEVRGPRSALEGVSWATHPPWRRVLAGGAGGGGRGVDKVVSGY